MDGNPLTVARKIAEREMTDLKEVGKRMAKENQLKQQGKRSSAKRSCTSFCKTEGTSNAYCKACKDG